MKNLNVIFAAIIFALFALTSCEKDGLQELNQTTTTAVSTEANTDRNLPAEGINMIFENIRTQASAATFKESAQGRNRGYKEIGCGMDYDGCTKGQGNSLDYRIYPDNVDALGAPFDGEDEYFFFKVEATPEAIMTYDIVLSEMAVDLDLFVFALNSHYQIIDTKGMSVNGGAKDEKLTLTDLNPGLYIVAVDAYKKGISGHYNLTMNCSAVSANPPSASITDNVTGITTTEASFVKILDQWIDGLEPPHFAVPYVEVAKDETSITIERTLVDGTMETTQTFEFDLVNNTVTITETSTHGVTIASSIRLDQIVSVTYDGAQPAAAVDYSNIEFAALGSTDGIGAFVQETDIKWYEYSFNSDVQHNFEQVAKDAMSISLRDEGRGVNIRLDFATMKVRYSDDNGTAFDLYEIIDMF